MIYFNLNTKALITLCVGFAFWENASEITRNASKTRASNILKRETQLPLAILHLAFWSPFGRVLARVESKTRPDANQDAGRGVTEAHRRIPFSSARRLFRRRAGQGASQTEEKKNLGTGVVETSARCRYRHHVHAPA